MAKQQLVSISPLAEAESRLAAARDSLQSTFERHQQMRAEMEMEMSQQRTQYEVALSSFQSTFRATVEALRS